MNASLLAYLSDLIFGFIEIVLGLRVVLKVFGANVNAPFVHWVYETTKPLIAPFSGMFPTPVLTNGFVIEISTLFSLLAYSLIAYLVNEIISFVGHFRNTYYEQDDRYQGETESQNAKKSSTFAKT